MQANKEVKEMHIGIDIDDIYVMCFKDPYTDTQRYMFIVGEDAAISFASNPHLISPKIYHAQLFDDGLIAPDERRLVWEKDQKILSFYDKNLGRRRK